MTGPEHYLEAEKFEAAVDDADSDAEALLLLTRAQVHATLALAAATALQTPGGEDAGMYTADVVAWEKACSAAAGDGHG